MKNTTTVDALTKTIINALVANTRNRCGTAGCSNAIPEGPHYVGRVGGDTVLRGTDIAICIDCAKVVEELLQERRQQA